MVSNVQLTLPSTPELTSYILISGERGSSGEPLGRACGTPAGPWSPLLVFHASLEIGKLLKVQTDTLPHARHGECSEIRGFVCTAGKRRIAHNSPSCRAGRMYQFFIWCRFHRYDKHELVCSKANTGKAVVSTVLTGQVEGTGGRRRSLQTPSRCSCWAAE